MTAASEDELAGRLRAGDSGAIAEAVTLLSVPHAYTAGRAAEMLADDGGDAGRQALLRAALTDAPLPVAWYGLDVARRVTGRWPGSAGQQGEAARRLVATEVHPDVAWWGIRLFVDAAPDTRRAIADRWHRATDDALAVEAIALAADVQPIPRTWLDRLRAVAGPSSALALTLRLRNGVRAAAGDAAAEALRGGPHAFELFDAIDELGPLEPVVRATWRPALSARWGVRPEHVRAVASLALADEPGAVEALWRFARRRRRDLQGLALAELLRVGGPDDAESVRQRVVARRSRSTDHVVGEAWRSPHPAARTLVVEVLGGHPDADVRMAAVDAGRRMPHPAVTAALASAAGADVDADVRASAAAAIAASPHVELRMQGA